MAKLASKVYGDALFDLAVEKGLTDSLYEEAGEIRATVLKDRELSLVMEHPGITYREKTELMERILAAAVSKEMAGFFHVVLEKDRYSEADAILAYFQDRVKEYRKIGVVYISTPTELKETQKKQIEEKVLAASPYETLECCYRVEPELMGGMVIRIRDRVVDSSLKTQLERISRNLLHLQIGKKV